MHVLSVAKSYSHRGGGHVHRHRTKKRWYTYFMTDDGGFGSKAISALMVPYYKSKIEKYRLMVCPVCEGIFTVFYKKPEELEEVLCPACSYNYSTGSEDDDD